MIFFHKFLIISCHSRVGGNPLIISTMWNYNYYIYILSNKNKTVLYIGVTNDLKRRMYEHKNKLIDGFTKKYNVDSLVYFEHFSNIEDAIAREKQLKKWNREWKDNLIKTKNPDWVDLISEIAD